jgi:tRNA G37 N-methylase TrmD
MAPGNHRDVFEFRYAESLAQTASYRLALFLRDHEILLRMSMLTESGIENPVLFSTI